MKLSNFLAADDVRRDLNALSDLHREAGKVMRPSGYLILGGQPRLELTHEEVDAILARRKAELMATFEGLGVEVDE